jgi:hypothetical protein
MKTHYKKGDRISYTFSNDIIEQIIYGIVESQTGTFLKIKWTNKTYRPQDKLDEVDYREVRPCVQAVSGSNSD